MLNLQNYLENNELLLSENYFKDLLKNKDENIDKFINSKFNSNKNIKLDKTNYHLFYLHYYNNKFNEFLKNIDVKIENIIVNKIIADIENNMLELELQKKLLPFQLSYKTFFNEEYLLNI